jgi:hypothetical protein
MVAAAVSAEVPTPIASMAAAFAAVRAEEP